MISPNASFGLAGGIAMDEKNGYGAQLFFLIMAIVIVVSLTRI